MKKTTSTWNARLLSTIAAALLLGLMGGSCKGKGGSSDMLTIAGSDTMVQLAQSLSRSFSEKFPDKKVSIQGGGSGTGIAAILNGTVDIANASRKMKEKEWNIAEKKGVAIREEVVALDMLAVVVHPDNPVQQLNIEQLSKIFTGAVTNWKDVGGADAPIVAISRENNSGTHVYFKDEVVRRGDKNSTAEYGDVITYAVSSQQIIDQTSSNKNAISYVGMGWLTDSVKSIAIQNSKSGKFITPMEAAEGNPDYPLARTLQMYVNESASQKSVEFMNFVKGEEGAKVIIELGFMPVK